MPNKVLGGQRRSMKEFQTAPHDISGGANPLPAQTSVASPEVIAQQLCSFHSDVLILRKEIREMREEVVEMKTELNDKQTLVISSLEKLVEIGEKSHTVMKENQIILTDSRDTMRALGYQGALLMNKGEEVLVQTKNVEEVVKRRVEQVDGGGVDAE